MSYRIAIIDQNTLAVIGLRNLLQTVLPAVEIDCYGSFSELEANHPDSYVHYFVAMNILLEHRDFFGVRHRKTIVLTMTTAAQVSDYHCLCVNVPERQLIRALLVMQQGAHPHGHNMPSMPYMTREQVLTNREAEVLALIVQGLINKEIAHRLGIGLSTVITHRKNIMEKLGLKSVSALTIYAIMHGYVDINRI